MLGVEFPNLTRLVSALLWNGLGDNEVKPSDNLLRDKKTK